MIDATQIRRMDVQTLRALVAEQVTVIAARERVIAEREAAITAHAQTIAAHEQTIATRDRTLVERDARIQLLTAEIARLRRMAFAARSEKMDPAQRTLFDETLAADLAAAEAQLEALRSTPAQPSAAPRPPAKRRELPAHLTRVETRHEPDQCQCGHCGSALVAIGEHVSERLSCKPLEFFVERHVYPQYACRACETITAEPVAPAIIERGIAAPALLAQIVISKYADHLPLYRQEAIYRRRGVELSRTVMAEWIGRVGVALDPLAGRLREQLRERPVLHADETPVGMLDPGAGKLHRSYLFAYRSADGPPVIAFDFCTSRSGAHARAFLGPWRGALMVDDYAGYREGFKAGITELACWAHARRKFVDQHQASGSKIAEEAIARISALYRIEAEAKDGSSAERHALRQRLAVPVLRDLKAWLTQTRAHTLGNSGTLNAIDYTLRRWDALARYADDGRYPIDNNPAENAIRPIALGRKNWLFAGSKTAGQRAAAIMSLIVTAKANGLDPHAWLTDVLTRLPTTLNKHLDTLLPTSWMQPLP